MKPYTYLIKHRPTGKVYYGVRSANKKSPEEDLWKEYFTSSPTVKQLITESGIESFEVQVRKVFETKEQAIQWEKTVLTRCQVLQKPEVWLNRNIAGYILPTEESCKKISEFHKGKPKTAEHKEKLKLSNLGKKKPPRTQEYRDNMSKLKSGTNNPMYGTICTEERAKKIGEANRGKIPANKGVPMSEEQKIKIKEAKKANPYKPSAEQRMKQSLSQTGQKRSDETKEKMRLARLAYLAENPMSHSAETKDKISKAVKGKSKSAESVAKRAETLKKMAAEGTHHSMIKMTCQYCGTTTTKLVHARWHGDNCKSRRNT